MWANAGWALIRSVKYVLQHGEGELIEKETIEMLQHGEGELIRDIRNANHCSMMKKTTSTAMIYRVYMKHHINKHTVNRKVKCRNYHRPSINHA